jgi:predicted adenylyl cyclase CyaB
MVKNIEVEIKSLIDEQKFEDLLSFFRKEAEFVEQTYQETHYFDCEQDVRIQRSSTYSKIILKKGELHDEQREETEVVVNKEDFEKLEALFSAMGMQTQVKWFRKRNVFLWDGIHVMLDNTVGFGYVLELEQMADEETKDEVLSMLRGKLSLLNAPLTSKAVLKDRFEYYRDNWREIVEKV